MTHGRTDGQMDGWTGGQTDESDFIGLCSTNAESQICMFAVT